MLKGIDISNWQAGLNIWNLDIEFAIMKATEGIGFVDSYCDNWVQQCRERGLKWGFYHFANNNDPIVEADYFISNTENYFNEGIPVLDIEDNEIADWGFYASNFCNRVHEITRVWPIVYCSASNLYRFTGWSFVNNCGLWVAGYPYPARSWNYDEMPYNIYPWEFAAIWQFTSSLNISGYDGNLDGNIAYMDCEAWDKYANATGFKPSPAPKPQPPEKSNYDIACEVIFGEWGDGDYRREQLEKAGYDYDHIQNAVNDMYSVAESVIHGDWGNGDTRRELLTNAGYNYDAIQHIVNDILK